MPVWLLWSAVGFGFGLFVGGQADDAGESIGGVAPGGGLVKLTVAGLAVYGGYQAIKRLA